MCGLFGVGMGTKTMGTGWGWGQFHGMGWGWGVNSSPCHSLIHAVDIREAAALPLVIIVFRLGGLKYDVVHHMPGVIYFVQSSVHHAQVHHFARWL